MPMDKQMEAAIIDMREILGRVDERVKFVVDSQILLTERFDKFMVAHTDLVERVARLEVVFSGVKVEEVEDNYHALKERMHAVELNQEVIEDFEMMLNSLSERVNELENITKLNSFKFDTWAGRFAWGGEVIFKCAWVLGMGWLLYKFGLGGVNFAP
jgi:hypothetical protein